MMIIPLRADNPMERYPIANWVIIGLNVLIFFATVNEINTPRWYGPDPLVDYILSPQHITLMSLVSYAFLHADILHLAGNMLFLFVFGSNINARMGHFQFSVCYLLLGMFSGLIHCAADSHSVIGASGAVCGITAMFVIWYPKYRVQMWWMLFLFRTGTFWMASIWVVLAWLILDLLGALGSSGDVAYIGHLGGYLGGFLAATGALFTRLVERDGEDIFTGRTAPTLTRPEFRSSKKTISHEDPIRFALTTHDAAALRKAYRNYLKNQSVPLSELELEKKALKRTLAAQDHTLGLAGLERLIHGYPHAPEMPGWLFNAAMIHAQGKNKTKAVNLLEQIVRDFPTWSNLDQAQSALAKLRGA